MLVLILSIISVILVWLIGILFKRNLLPEIILGLIIGFSWELTTAPLWNYNPNTLTLFYVEGEDLSLEVITFWGSVLALLSLMIEFMQKNIFKKSNNATFFFSSLILFVFVGWVIEYVGINYNFWSYSWRFSNFIFGIPVVVMYGWVFASILYMPALKFYRDDVERVLTNGSVARFPKKRIKKV
jgi:hypothetical protein